MSESKRHLTLDPARAEDKKLREDVYVNSSKTAMIFIFDAEKKAKSRSIRNAL